VTPTSDDDRPAADPAAEGKQPGIQSIEVGMRLVSALVRLTADAPPPMLKTLAEAAGMPPAKAHRYIVSLLRCGMIERDPATSHYRLGPMARDIGFSAVRTIDLVKTGNRLLGELCATLRHTVALAVWTHHGPTIVCVEEFRRPVTIATRVGEIMPMLSSATGRVFAAWLAPAVSRPFIDAELTAGPITTEAEAEAIVAATRAAGLGWTQGGLNATVNALSAPLFDYRGALAGAVSALGPAEDFDVALDGPLAAALRAAGHRLSRDLGHVP
jgi:DNA-binding IclR family transcriptional regulator